MRSEQAKAIIRQSWSRADRVAGWSASQLNREFADPAARKAWKSALRRATAGLPPRRRPTALDLGTGPGTIAQLWAELGFTTTGLDFSPAMLEAGRSAATERKLQIEFVEGDAETPPLAGRKFDVISSRFLLFTLLHPGLAVRRWRELLRPGGLLALIGHDRPPEAKCFPHHDGGARPAQPKWRAHPRHREALDQLPFAHHNSGELSVVLEAAGFQDVRRISLGRVIAARAALNAGEPDTEHRPPPFLLIGRK